MQIQLSLINSFSGLSKSFLAVSNAVEILISDFAFSRNPKIYNFFPLAQRAATKCVSGGLDDSLFFSCQMQRTTHSQSVLIVISIPGNFFTLLSDTFNEKQLPVVFFQLVRLPILCIFKRKMLLN